MFTGAKRTDTAGFTLIEVLISMVIFSIVIALAVLSYRFSLQQLTSPRNGIDIDLLSRVKLINQQVREAFAYGYVDELGKQVPFFLGNKNGFAFVSRSPMLLSEPMAVSMVYQQENEIRYCESPFGAIALNSFKLTESYCSQSISFMSATKVHFEYFGWKDWLEFSNYYSEYLNIAVKPKPQWSNVFDASQRKVMPLFIRISLSSGIDSNHDNRLMYKVSRIPPSLLGANSE